MSDGHGANTPISSGFAFVFIKPILATLLGGLMLGAGLFSASSMVKEGQPDLDIPIATVQTTWVGASPEMVEKQVTNELERAVKSVENVKKVTSTSRRSFSLVTVEFSATASVDGSLQRLRDEVSKVEAKLPADADKPSVEAVRLIDRPIVSFNLYGNIDDALLSKLAHRLKDGLEKLQGVREAEISGARDEIVSVLLHPERATELNLAPHSVAASISAANTDSPLGDLEHPEFRANFELKSRFTSIAELEALVVRRTTAQSVPITLGEVSDIRRDLERPTVRTSLSQKGTSFTKAVAINIFKAPGVDTVRLVERAAEYLENAQRTWSDWPDAVKLARLDDDTESIQQSLSSTLENAGQAMVVVFLVLLLMLTWREALVAGLAIPVTFLASLAGLNLLGYTLNEMVLVGMILALGLLVDVFILVMEGMHDALYEDNATFPQAVRRTVSLYALPAFAGQMTTVLALVPLFAIGGNAGKFIQIIPATIIVCLIASFLVAFLVALPLSRAVLSSTSADLSAVDKLTHRLSAVLTRWIRDVVVASKVRAAAFVVGAVAALFVAFSGAGYLDFVLFPKSDDPKVGVTLELGPYAALDDTAQAAALVGQFLKKQPEVTAVTQYVGRASPLASRTGATEQENLAGFSASLVPLSDRAQSSHVLTEKWRPEIEKLLRPFAGVATEMHVKTGGASSGAPIQLIVSGPEQGRLRDYAGDVKRVLAATSGVTEATDDMGLPQTSVTARPRVELLDLFGLSATDVAQQARYWLSTTDVGTYDRPGTQEPLDIVMSMRWPSKKGLEGSPERWNELAQMGVVDTRGRRHALWDLAHLRIEDTLAELRHRDGDRAVTVSGYLGDRSAASVMQELQPKLDALTKTWLGEYTLTSSGESEDTAETFADVPFALLMAVFLVFAVLALLFVSFRQPLIILASIPMALIGTLLGFFLADIPFSFPAMVGVIALIGIVVNDAIVMVETMNERLGEGLSVKDAAARGAADRLRPIVSTTLTTVGGMIPLAISSPMWMPIAMAITFGLLGATLVAFMVIPALFALVTPEGHRGADSY